MIDFNSINTNTAPTPGHDPFYGLLDCIRDSLEADAPDWKVFQAYAAQTTNKLDGYKMTAPMLKFWFSQTPVLRAIGDEDATLLLDIVHHFEAALERCTNQSVGNH
jgi:hypothetical protein